MSGWMESSADFQTHMLQSQKPARDHPKELALFGRVGKTSDAAYKAGGSLLRCSSDGAFFGEACFSSFMSMHCSSIFPRCTTPFSRAEFMPVGGRVPMCFPLRLGAQRKSVTHAARGFSVWGVSPRAGAKRVCCQTQVYFAAGALSRTLLIAFL